MTEAFGFASWGTYAFAPANGLMCALIMALIFSERLGCWRDELTPTGGAMGGMGLMSLGGDVEGRATAASVLRVSLLMEQ